MSRKPPSPETVIDPVAAAVAHAQSNGESSPVNSRRERYGIATIMPRGTGRQQPAVSPQPTTLTAQPADVTPARPRADNSFDSVPTDYDISDTTSRSRSGEPVTTTSMDSSSSATGLYPVQNKPKVFYSSGPLTSRDYHKPEVVASPLTSRHRSHDDILFSQFIIL